MRKLLAFHVTNVSRLFLIIFRLIAMSKEFPLNILINVILFLAKETARERFKKIVKIDCEFEFDFTFQNQKFGTSLCASLN